MAYDVCIEFDNAYTTGMVVVKYGNGSDTLKKDIPISAIENEIVFEEFLKDINREWKEVTDDRRINPERFDLP